MNIMEMPYMPWIALGTMVFVALAWLRSWGSMFFRSMITLVPSLVLWVILSQGMPGGNLNKFMGVWVIFLLMIPMVFKEKDEVEDTPVVTPAKERPFIPRLGRKNRPAAADHIVDLENKVVNESAYNLSAPTSSDEYVYVVDNPAFTAGLVKIGMTTQSDYDNRIRSLQNTGTPLPFNKRLIIATGDARSLERHMHTMFDHKRLAGNREFFTVDPQEIVDMLPRLGDARLVEANL